MTAHKWGEGPVPTSWLRYETGDWCVEHDLRSKLWLWYTPRLRGIVVDEAHMSFDDIVQEHPDAEFARGFFVEQGVLPCE